MSELSAPLPGHTVVRVRGEDPLGFLDATTTQAVRDLKPGRETLACLLDEKGHVLSEFRVLAMPDGSALLDGEPAAREGLTGWLARVAPLSGCEVIDESSMWHARRIHQNADGDEHSFVTDGRTIRIVVQWGGEGYDELSLEEFASGQHDEGLIERARIEDGRALFGIDVTPDMILNETPLITRAVSFTKGCYPGQETVAKIHNLGRARRGFVMLRFPDSAPQDNEFDGGRITSAIGDVALAFVRAEIAEQRTIDIGGVRARITKVG